MHSALGAREMRWKMKEIVEMLGARRRGGGRGAQALPAVGGGSSSSS